MPIHAICFQFSLFHYQLAKLLVAAYTFFYQQYNRSISSVVRCCASLSMPQILFQQILSKILDDSSCAILNFSRLAWFCSTTVNQYRTSLIVVKSYRMNVASLFTERYFRYIPSVIIEYMPKMKVQILFLYLSVRVIFQRTSVNE